MKRVEDVMTNNVLVVAADAPYKEIVRVMQERGITGVPVIDRNGCVLGVISESDLVFKEEHTGGHRFEFGRKRTEHEKASARTAAELMSKPPVTIGPKATIVEAARTMSDQHIKRLPVVDERGKVVGIVTRRDLLKVFLRTDEEITSEITDDLIPHKMWLTPDEGRVHVAVERGVVTLTGTMERRSVAEMLRSMVERVDGVVSVESHVGFRTDDTHYKPQAERPWGVLPDALRRP